MAVSPMVFSVFRAIALNTDESICAFHELNQ